MTDPTILLATDVSGAPLFLRIHVFAVVVDDDLVVLDLDRDDYLCIAGAAAHFHPAVADRPCQVSGPLADALRQAGLAQAELGEPARSLPPTPSKSVLHDAPERLRLSDLGPLAAATIKVRRTQSDDGIISQLAVAGDAFGEGGQGPVLRAASAFWRIQPWLPFDGECLQRSMLLMAFLRELGLSADWVFGVRLWPFSAHCWLQSGEICLNDDHERLRAYTPIFCR